ncbi:MAG: phosphotransferase enzyme family protein [Gammaproteobacteria bacterium]
MTNSDRTDFPASVCEAFTISADADVCRVASGLINATWVVQSAGRKFVLQRLNNIFGAEVNKKIDAVTEHLSNKGVTTTGIVRTQQGELEVFDGPQCWRALKFLEGQTYLCLDNLKQARSAGRTLGEFHTAMEDFPGQCNLPQSTVHNIDKHESALKLALTTYEEHANFAAIRTLAVSLLRSANELKALPDFQPTTIHGDPKISNFLFDSNDSAQSIIDLDTISRGQLLHDLGDAFRSWCNPNGEDTEQTIFDLSLFENAFRGYVAGTKKPIDRTLLACLPLAIETIYLELAMRFCADALAESYFAWDPHKFASSTEHQLTRARGQFCALNDFKSKLNDVSAVIEEVALE